MERQFKLGVDVNEYDSLLDGFTFGQVIDALHCGEKVINETAVRKVVQDILNSQLQDLYTLLDGNLGEIVKLASKGRE